MCAGIAKTYGIDITLVRVLAIVAGVMWIGIPAYLIAWIAIPADDGSTAITDQPRDVGMIAGLVLIGIGALIAIDHVLPTGFRGGHFFGPFLLIAGGIAILVFRRPVDPDAAPEPRPAPEPEDAIVTDPWSAAVTASSPADAEDVRDAEPATEEPQTAWTQTAPWPSMRDARQELRGEPWAHPWHDHRRWREEARRLRHEARERHRELRRRRPRPFIGPLTLSLLLIGAGVVSLLQATEVVDVNLTVALAIATAFVGLMLAFTAWVGRARGLIAVGLVLALATSASAVLDVPLSGGLGEQTYRPASAAELKREYKLAIGELTVDLRSVQLTGPTEVDVQLGIGELRVYLPPDARVQIDAEAGAGRIDLLGEQDDGMHVDQFRTVGSGPLLELDLRVGAGNIEVTT